MSIDAVPSYLFTKNVRFAIKAVVWHPDAQSNKFLVLKRAATEFTRPSTLDIPGGGVNFKELYQDGLRRELYEEAGLKIQGIQDLILFTSYQEDRDIYNIIVGVSAQAIDPTIRLSGEHQNYSWMTPEEFLSQHPNYYFVANRTFDIQKTDFICDIVTKAAWLKTIENKGC